MKSFSAKIILFGEYSILNGSKALAIPFPAFSGRLLAQHKKNESSQASATIIKDIFTYLKNQQFEAVPNFDTLQQQIAQGLYFDSNIPEGYGLGSSGALVAAVYSTFFNGFDELSTKQIKTDLARMESFFHGTSSGIDPLVSFLNAPVLVKQESVETLQLAPCTDFKLVLIDTGHKAATQGLVQYYKNLINDKSQSYNIEQLKQTTNRCIEGYLQNSLKFNDLKSLSELQQQLLKPMFVLNKPLINAARNFQDDAALKLCGSGGGGFVAAFVNQNKSDAFCDYLMQHKLTFHRV